MKQLPFPTWSKCPLCQISCGWDKISLCRKSQPPFITSLLHRFLSFFSQVKEETLVEALTKKKTMAGGETVVMSHKMPNVNSPYLHILMFSTHPSMKLQPLSELSYQFEFIIYLSLFYVGTDYCTQAIATRDAMAKCLYASLFDWIVLQINHALLAKPRETRTESQVSF